MFLGVVTAVNVRQVRKLRVAGHAAADLDHGRTVGEGLGEPVRLLVLGDSAARGHGLTDPGQAFPAALGRELARRTGRRVAVACLAADGDRTADVLTRQVPLVRAHQPDVLVASVGVNDAVRMTPLGRVTDDTASLVAALDASAAPDVALVTCPDLGTAPGFPVPLRWLVGWRCRAVAAAQARGAARAHAPGGVTLASLEQVEARHYGTDGFHPGPAGHAAMAATVADALVPSRTSHLT